MDREFLLKQIKLCVQKIEPKAKIILFGSRARRDSHKDSDWDFLILVDGEVTDERIDKIRHSLYEIEWEYDVIISSIIRSQKEWDSPFWKDIPFHRNVELEGIVL